MYLVLTFYIKPSQCFGFFVTGLMGSGLGLPIRD